MGNRRVTGGGKLECYWTVNGTPPHAGQTWSFLTWELDKLESSRGKRMQFQGAWMGRECGLEPVSCLFDD